MHCSNQISTLRQCLTRSNYQYWTKMKLVKKAINKIISSGKQICRIFQHKYKFYGDNGVYEKVREWLRIQNNIIILLSDLKMYFGAKFETRIKTWMLPTIKF